MNVYLKSALLGAASGVRTSAGPLAAAAASTRSLPIRNAVAFGGELVADKMPNIGSRTRVGSLFARASAATYAARSLPGWSARSLAVAVVAAVAASFACERARMALAARTKAPQQVIGLVEDALVIGLIYVIARDRPTS